MLNTNFKAAVKSATSVEKQRGNLWWHLVYFAADVLKNNPSPEAMPAAFKTQEDEATSEMKVEIGKNSTYRSNKSVVCSAVEYRIQILDAKGKPRGKTEVEKEIAAAKGKKPALSRFQTVLKSADSIADELDDGDCVLAAALVDALLKKVASRIRKAA